VFSVDEIARIVVGECLFPAEVPVHRAVHDSRIVEPGDLFVALRGSRTDGHRFLSDAYARGASAALVSDRRAIPPEARNAIVVPEPLVALRGLAAAWRRAIPAVFVGITGSNGKTTTKRLLTHFLSSSRAVYVAPGNYNTEIGLPLALTATPPSTDVGIFELGAERPGEIAPLAETLSPSLALLTTVGPSHLAAFGTLDAIAAEKWALVESLPREGVAIVNADDPRLRARAAQSTRPCITVGFDVGEVRARIVATHPQLVVRVEHPSLHLEAPLLGRHNGVNLLLAAVAAVRLGAPAGEIERRARTYTPVAHRLEPRAAAFGTVLDDTYNANPASTAAALRVLAETGNPKTRRIFVFGDMLDLGSESDGYHREIAHLAAGLGIDRIYPIGERATSACRAVASGRTHLIPRDRLATELLSRLPGSTPDAVVLVKGSRALRLEELVDALLAP